VLADEILGNSQAGTGACNEIDINYSMRSHRSPAYLALRIFMQAAICNYLDEAPERGLDAVLGPPPTVGMLGGASVVLRGDGRNGEHIHSDGYVSVVYYVQVPDSIVESRDERGALALGRCEQYTGGYTPCWGTRYIKPVAGWLVVFPSHIFHDVVPSKTNMARISVAADLKPKTQAAPPI
jgi:hypothetical protein